MCFTNYQLFFGKKEKLIIYKSVCFVFNMCIIVQTGRARGGDAVKQPEIIELLRRHDERGMQALLLHYGPLMRYVIAPILPDAHDQADCMSEVTVRIWEKIDQFDANRGSLNAWLTAISRNTALNYARKNARRGETEELPPDTPSPEPTPEEVVLQKERQAALHSALEKLSPQDRMLFYRKYYYMQPTAQIASESGMTERAVEGRLYRLKKRLRRMLGGEAHE